MSVPQVATTGGRIWTREWSDARQDRSSCFYGGLVRLKQALKILVEGHAIFLRPPRAGQALTAAGVGIQVYRTGNRVASATATDWVSRLAEAQHRPVSQTGHSAGPRHLFVSDEIGYVP